jgi:predicted dehydrogenase
VRIAVCGSGFAADLHVRAARAAGAHVVGVASHHADRTAAFAHRHEVDRHTTDWETLVTDADVDAVVVATPNALHAPQAVAALSASKHVLIEKPVALDLAEADTIAAAAATHGATVVVGHMWRYRDEVVALRDQVRRGVLGRVVRTHGFGVHAQWGPSGWFTDPALAGGGALIDMGIHAIDTARFLLDDPEPVRVQASLGTEMRDGAVDDDGVVIVDWSNGTRSLVEFGWWQPHLGGLEAETDVFGTQAHARIWPGRPPVPDDYEHCSLPMYAAQMRDLVHCCTTGADPVASLAVGRTALAVVRAAYDAARDTARGSGSGGAP